MKLDDNIWKLSARAEQRKGLLKKKMKKIEKST